MVQHETIWYSEEATLPKVFEVTPAFKISSVVCLLTRPFALNPTKLTHLHIHTYIRVTYTTYIHVFVHIYTLVQHTIAAPYYSRLSCIFPFAIHAVSHFVFVCFPYAYPRDRVVTTLDPKMEENYSLIRACVLFKTNDIFQVFMKIRFNFLRFRLKFLFCYFYLWHFFQSYFVFHELTF